MIPYLSYFQDIPVRIIRNRRLRAKTVIGLIVGLGVFLFAFAAASVEPGSRLFVVYLSVCAALFAGFMGYAAYRQTCSVPAQLEPCPYCGDFLAFELLWNWYPIYDLSVCGACRHDFDTPLKTQDMRPGSFETPPQINGLQGR